MSTLSEKRKLIFRDTDVIYLDYNATTPVDPSVAEAIWPYLTIHFGNASSSHHFGEESSKALNNARKQIAKLIGVEHLNSKCIVFTSGSTEAMNQVLKMSALKQRKKSLGNHIITTKIEHPAVLNTVRYLETEHDFTITYLDCDSYGMIQPNSLSKALTENTILVSIMHANNEIGTINPIHELCKMTKSYNKSILFHSDTAQSIGKIPDVHPYEWGVDFITIAGHKIYAPKGIGAMYINPDLFLNGNEWNLLHGANQEYGLRPGTENVPYCVALGKAAELCLQNTQNGYIAKCKYLTHLLHECIMQNIPNKYHRNIRTNGHPFQRIPNTLSISFAFLKNTLITNEIFEHIACSTGAACHSGSVKLSYVLDACGVNINYGMGTLRLSTGKYTTEDEVIKAGKIIGTVVSRLYKQSAKL